MIVASKQLGVDRSVAAKLHAWLGAVAAFGLSSWLSNSLRDCDMAATGHLHALLTSDVCPYTF